MAERDERLVAVVLDLVSETLGRGQAMTPTTQLLELPGCTSLAIATLVERLEERLQVEIAPELIVPETFATPLTIARALGGAP
ncbi:MAG TPA: acyl carrier protein [Candidatus Dormibacteraeota bacterium]|nr:acyl carrier protein [Candidatus Dormibacteraeota bacterium]